MGPPTTKDLELGVRPPSPSPGSSPHDEGFGAGGEGLELTMSNLLLKDERTHTSCASLPMCHPVDNVLIKNNPPQLQILRRGGGGGILDQDVIHNDTWLRKHSSSFKKMFEIFCTTLHRRSLEQVQRKRKFKIPKILFFLLETTAILKKYLVFKSIKLTATYIKVERGFHLHHQFKHARN